MLNENTKEKDAKDKRFCNLLAFIALMQNGDGMISKSPEYIKEKYNRFLQEGYVLDGGDIAGLDLSAQNIISDYIERWESELHSLFE